MPTTTRLLLVLVLLAAGVFAAMLALVHFVEPRQVETVTDMPIETLRQMKP
jgi:hypothetical protein